MSMYPEWLNNSRAQFLSLSRRLPHALLIHGEPGVGKHLLAMEIVAALICDQAVETERGLEACGQCKNCVMFDSGNHPDFHYISTERDHDAKASAHLSYAERYLEALDKRGKRKPRAGISVDQIRSLIDDFALSHHSSDHKVALIQPADAMNTNAANALLKLLEEPNPDSVLLLVCDDSSRLPMTIRSRCITLAVQTPDTELSLPWLQAQGLDASDAAQALAISGNAPLLALDYAKSAQVEHFRSLLKVLNALVNEGMSPVEAREALLKLQSPAILLAWLQKVVSWLIATQGMEQSLRGKQFSWQAYQRELGLISKRFDVKRSPALFSLYDDLSQLKRQNIEVINSGLMLDKWLIAFSQKLAT